MAKLTLLIFAILLIGFPIADIGRKEDLLLFGGTAILELVVLTLFFKRVFIPVYLVVPISIVCGLFFATFFWVLATKLGMQGAGQSQQQEIASYFLMISFALSSVSHVIVRISDYQKAKRYVALIVNIIFSIICCVFAMSYWP